MVFGIDAYATSSIGLRHPFTWPQITYLPNHDGNNYSVTVTGANGISCSATVPLLSQFPDRCGPPKSQGRRERFAGYCGRLIEDVTM